MKKRLLITLGCSMTEGIGCYDFDINPKKIHYCKLEGKQLEQTLHSFHKNGWPNYVGKNLNFDKVLNLGHAGTSNSTHLKLFTDKVLPQIDKLNREYDIFLIWLMTEPTRFSFYNPSTIMRFQPTDGIDGLTPTKALEKAYVQDVREFSVGPAREQIFYIKLAEALFKQNKIKPVFTSWSPTFHHVHKLYDTDLFISPSPFGMVRDLFKAPEAISEVKDCFHPNQIGYEHIGRSMIKQIKEFHPYFLSERKVEEFNWEWDGNITYNPPIVKVRRNIL